MADLHVLLALSNLSMGYPPPLNRNKKFQSLVTKFPPPPPHPPRLDAAKNRRRARIHRSSVIFVDCIESGSTGQFDSKSYKSV